MLLIKHKKVIDKIEKMSINQRIRDGRLALKLTEAQFAERAGVSRASVQQWEREGGYAPNRRHQQKVADALEIPLAELLTGGTTPYVTDPGKVSRSKLAQALAGMFDLAVSQLDKNERNRVFTALIQELGNQTTPASERETPQIDTPAQHSKA